MDLPCGKKMSKSKYSVDDLSEEEGVDRASLVREACGE